MAKPFKPAGAPSGGSATSTNIQSTIALLPQLLQAVNSGAGANAAGMLSTAQGVTPGYQSLLDAGMTAGTANDAARASSPDASTLISSLVGLENQANPQWAADRTLANSKATDLVNSYDLNGLTGGESAAIERANGMQNFFSGNGSTPNATTTTENAMNFGTGYDTKRANLTTAIGNLNSTANAYKSSVNPETAIFGNDAIKAGNSAGALSAGQGSTTQATDLAQGIMGVGSAANSSSNQFLGSQASIDRSTTGGINSALSSY